MSRVEKLQHIYNLVKKADQKKLSELSEEEYQAVLFCCSAMPAKLDGVLAKSDIHNGKETTFQPPYKWLASNIQQMVGKVTGFSNRKTPNIFIDITPRTPEFTKDWRDALDSFPSWKVFYKPDDETYAHLPFLKHPGYTVEDPSSGVNFKDFKCTDENIAYGLMRTSVRIAMDHELDKQDLAVIALCKDRYIKVKRIAEKLSVLSCFETIRDCEPEGEYPKGSLYWKDVKHLGLSEEAVFLGLVVTGRFLRLQEK